MRALFDTPIEDGWVALPAKWDRSGCICNQPRRSEATIHPDCKYHAAAARRPWDHSIPWNCPTFWDGCNCDDGPHRDPAPGDTLAVVETCENCGGQGRGVGSSTAHAFINGRLRAVGAGGQMMTTVVCPACHGKGHVRTGFVRVVETLPIVEAYTVTGISRVCVHLERSSTPGLVERAEVVGPSEVRLTPITLPNAVPGGVALRVEPTLTSGQWVEVTGERPLGTDGWDRANFEASWNEPITFEEFDRRLMASTVFVGAAGNFKLVAPVTRTDGGSGPLGTIEEGESA